MDFREHIQVWLSFSKKERYGIYLILFVYLLLLLVPLGFSDDGPPEDVLDIRPLELSSARDSLKKKQELGGAGGFAQDKQAGRRRYGYNNNSRASSARYEEQHSGSGAAFSTPSPPGAGLRSSSVSDRRHGASVASRVIDINLADSAALERLPAIGEKLSSRIIRYRDRLGGFLSMEQLEEVYGLQDSTLAVVLPFLRINPSFVPRKININRASLDEMARHPYLGYPLAKLLMAYRQQHGTFISADAVKRAVFSEAGKIEKFLPYCSFED
jgi:competence protein ComEA